jgi:kynureninase
LKALDVVALDRADKLAHKIADFDLPKNCIYLNGNSLGPPTRHVKEEVLGILSRQWGTDLVSSWNSHGWIDLPVTVGEKIAQLVGAGPGQVICCDSISINLFKILSSCLSLSGNRSVILSERNNFPTDLYVAQGIERLIGSDLCQLRLVGAEDIVSSITDDVGVLLLSHVNFRDGGMLDMKSITDQAHKKGALVVWDLAHSAGVFPIFLDECGVDFAVGCGYKYLNGGPGAPSFLYVNQKLQGQFAQPLQGWMGHASPFDFDLSYRAASGVSQFLCGTPPILSLGALDAALDIFADVNIGDLAEKAGHLRDVFLALLESEKNLVTLKLESPKGGIARGAQLSFSHSRAYGICRALHADGVIADFRSPDLIRFGFSPLFLDFASISDAVGKLANIMRNKIFDRQEFNAKQKVT